jgi:hypothetical protein
MLDTNIGMYFNRFCRPDIPIKSLMNDPIIADIACDSNKAQFNGGNGADDHCRQKYASDLLFNANLAAVLALGDTQYY